MSSSKFLVGQSSVPFGCEIKVIHPVEAFDILPYFSIA